MLIKESHALTVEDRELLNVYHHSFDDDKVDLDLIMALLYKIHQNSGDGECSFLNVFLHAVKVRKQAQSRQCP
jgi:hypothetical protein